jgi:hypothetical protein
VPSLADRNRLLAERENALEALRAELARLRYRYVIITSSRMEYRKKMRAPYGNSSLSNSDENKAKDAEPPPPL